MKIKSEKTGHGHHKGMVHFRWSFYLKNGDYRYDEFGSSSPCHNHFMYIDPTISNTEIDDLRDAFLVAFEPKWNADQYPYASNGEVPFWPNPPQYRIDECLAKVGDLKTKDFEKEKNNK